MRGIRRINGRITLLVAAATLLVVVFGSRGRATVRPVRFEEPPESRALREEVTDNPFQVEPYLLRVSLESGETSTTGLVGKSVVIPLCGDGDGCRVRLIQTVPNAAQESRLASGELLTDAVAVLWRFYENSNGGNNTASGSTNNGSDETALEIVSAGGNVCRLRDDSVFDSYQLDASKVGANLLECLIRIDD